MTTFRYSLALIALGLPASAQEVMVPSGMKVALFDVIVEDSPATARFRFLAPAIDPAGQAAGFDDVVDDMQYLCDDLVRPALVETGFTAGNVIISYSAKEIPFGETAPDVMQFFQPFELQGDTCAWTDF